MKYHTILLASIILLTACQENSELPDVNIPIAVELNNGQKWQANPETTKGIQNMHVLIKNFTRSNDLTAYHRLQSDLQEEFTSIFQQCTMTGEAHNQLHNYLIPLNKSIKKLESSNLDTCDLGIRRLEYILPQYKRFFE